LFTQFFGSGLFQQASTNLPGADRSDTLDADRVLVAGQLGAASSITPSSPSHFSITEIAYLSIKSAIAEARQGVVYM
jgi:hypothetical protein